MRAGRTLLTGLALAVVLVGAAVTPAAATQETSPSLTVELQADGDADVTVVSTFDLDSDDEQAAFDELRNNETAREAYTARFEDRWRTVAANTADETGREMTVSDASLELTRDGSTGVATFTVTWTDLAAVEGDTLTLSAPFDDEFTPDRRFVVVLPDGYELTSSTPDRSADGRLVYEAGTDFDGFTVVAEASDSTTATGGSGPGFGVAAAILGLLAAALLVRRG
jgi:PGF-CTERM protein